MNPLIVTFAHERETPSWHHYVEMNEKGLLRAPDDKQRVVGNLYVSKDHLPGTPPESIEVTIRSLP
jgi:hypothetical protein